MVKAPLHCIDRLRRVSTMLALLSKHLALVLEVNKVAGSDHARLAGIRIYSGAVSYSVDYDRKFCPCVALAGSMNLGLLKEYDQYMLALHK